MTISFTTFNNLQLPDATTVDIYAVFNANFQLIDAGLRASALSGSALAQYVPVYVDGTGRFQLADNTRTPSSATPTVGLTMFSVAASGVTTYVMYLGIVTNPAWAWTPGGKVYVGAVAGTLTQTANACPVGLALTATTVLLLPSRS